MFSRRDQIAVYGFPRKGGGALVPTRGKDIYVWAAARASNGAYSYQGGNDEATGSDWGSALRTMQEALARAKSCDRIFFTGDVREELGIASTGLTDLNLKFDITIQGCAGLHHPDQPGSGTALYDAASAMWRPPASPTATTPLLNVYGRGWKFYDIAFDCPVDAAAVKLNANSSSGTSEYDASHARFYGCLFQQGKYAIEDNGGAHRVWIEGCTFSEIKEASGCAILNTSTSVRVPQYWHVLGNTFPGNGQSGGNEAHIDAPLSGAIIKDNVFGTVEGTGVYIDLTGGDDNSVVGNYLGGVYDTDDYKPGTADLWLGNWVTVISTQAPNGFTILAPAAP